MGFIIMMGLKQILPVNKNVAFLFVLICICPTFIFGKSNSFEAKSGVLQISDYDFDTLPTIELRGEFYCINKITTNTDSILQFGQKKQQFEDTWYKIKNKSFGARTYLLRVYLNSKYKQYQNNQILGLRIRHVFSAYRLYINGELLAQKGIVANKKADYHTQFGYKTIFFSPNSDSLTFILQVANFLNPGVHGAEEALCLGSQEQILKETVFNNYLFMLSFGVMVLFTFYHFMYYFLRRREPENLCFAIICALFAIKCLCEGDKMIFAIFPHLSSVIYYKVWFLSVDILYFLILFYHSLFPKEVRKWFVTVALIVFSTYSVIILVLPVSYGFFLSKIIYLYSISVILYACVGMFRAVINKRSYAWPNLLGIIPPTILGINDLLFAVNIVETGYYSAIGFMFYIISQSVTITYKSAQVFNKVESLTDQLADTNQNLEKLVEIRTTALNNANKTLLQTNETKDRFFTILAHDLRGPISTIRSLLELIVVRQESYSKEKMAMMINVLNDTSRSTYDLLDNLLCWAKTQTQEITINKIECDLHEIIEENVSLFVSAAKQKNIILINAVIPSQNIYCDRNMTSTVIRNLLNNAIKFTIAGSIRVSASDNNSLIEIRVDDTGVGMNPETTRALFNNEVVLQSSHGTAGEKGSGLGLVLCREFIVMQGGSIQVKSAIGEGTSFRVLLPLTK